MFTVPPLSEQTVKVNLNQGDCVNGTFSASGGTGTGVDFAVMNPNGKELLSYNYTTLKTFSFSASTAGTYELSFDNSFCSCEGGKNVMLTYSVSKPVQGSLAAKSNQEFPFIIVLILVIVIVAAAVVVMMMRRQKINVNNAAVQPQATRVFMVNMFRKYVTE